MFIAHLHAFRGFAIINIVAAHSWELPFILTGGTDGSLGLRLIGALARAMFHDSTLYFALISGLLFSLVLRPKGWAAFFASKLRNVLSPYVVVTLLLTYVSWDVGGGPNIFDGNVSEYFLLAFKNLLLGSGFYHLWYIPVLLCLYLLTPAIISIWNRLELRWLVWAVIFAPLIASRVWPEQSLTNVFYFLGAYTVGIATGTSYETMVSLLRRHAVSILVVIAVTTILLLLRGRLLIGSVGITSLPESLWYVQKLSLAALVLPWLQTRESVIPDWLNKLATNAFSIYFLHGILVVAASGLFVYLDLVSCGAITVFLYGLGTLVAALVICSACSQGLRYSLGKYSRMLIGA